MSDDIKFANGIWYHPPTAGQGSFMFGRLNISRERFANWLLDECEGDYVNLDIMHSKKGGDSGESLAGKYLITFYGFGCIVFGALSIWAIIDLIETKRRGAVSVCRLVLFCVGFVYLLYKLVNSV